MLVEDSVTESCTRIYVLIYRKGDVTTMAAAAGAAASTVRETPA